MHYLFVAALKEEIDFSFLEKVENVSFLYTGVGKTNSAINLLKYLYENKDIDLKKLHVVNVGTCGSSKYEIGDVISVTCCQEFGSGFVSTCYELNDLSPTIPLACFRDSVLSGDFFISTKTLNENTFADFTVEYKCFDMELAALARVCKVMNVKISSFKIVSDTLKSDISDWEEVLSLLSPEIIKLVKFIIK